MSKLQFVVVKIMNLMEEGGSETLKHFVSEIFVELEQCGLRGDPLLWKYLKNYYAAIELPYPVEHLKEDILRIFKDFTGELPVREKYYFVKEFSKNCNCIKYGDNAMKEFFLRIVSIC